MNGLIFGAKFALYRRWQNYYSQKGLFNKNVI